MTLLIAGLILFLGPHSVSIVAPAWRDRVAGRWGVFPWQALYSVVAITGFVLIIKGYGGARTDAVHLYSAPHWSYIPAVLLQVFVFPLLLATYLPGRIKAAVKHPMLAATMLWAAAHLLVSGAVANVVLFGSFLAWAVADRVSMGHRAQRPLPGAPPSRWNDAVAVVGGLGLYAAFLLGMHRWLFGVSPLG